MLLDDDYVRRCLARVCNNDGATLGTAFFVLSADGVALTCHHLVENKEKVLLDCGDGRQRVGLITAADRFPEIDLAIVRCVDDPPRCALAIEADSSGITRFWTKGYHFYGADVTDALPATGEISGVTEIQFSTLNETRYKLSGVLVLKNDVFDPGLSGAPVLDPETGVVFAMINAKFLQSGPVAGFALPLSRMNTHSPKLVSLFESNRNTVPRYGRFLNHIGASEVCRLQRDRIIDLQIRREFFLSDLYCKRAGERNIEAFFESGALILPIVGNAGVGKTMLMAEMARRSERNVVLLLGRDLRDGETDLSLAVTSRLQEVAGKLLGREGDASRVAAALRNGGRQLTVLFDGLNEIPARLSGDLQAWIERTITWLEETDTRLVLSCRPEFWAVAMDLFPKPLLFSMDNQEQTRSEAGIRLGDFSEEEANNVIERYGFSESLSARDIRHPLMARIYWEMKQEEVQGRLAPTARYDALQRFIEMKCDRMARALGPGVVRSYVEVSLKQAARASLARGGFEIGQEEFFGIFTDNPQLGNQLLLEGVFTTTSNGVRFVFDEIGEFVQAQTMQMDALISEFSGARQSQLGITAGTAVFLILRFDDYRQDEEVDRAIEAIVTAHVEGGRKGLICENIIAQVLPQLREPGRFTSQIGRLAREMTRQGRFSSEADRFELRATVTRLGIPLEFKLDLLRLFLPKEDSYDFEHHHWKNLKNDVFRLSWHTATLLGEVIHSSPERSFEVLSDWLTDMTPLSGNNSRISDAAMALMYYFRHLAFETLCEILARSPDPKAEFLLTEIAQTDIHETADLCLRWVEQNDPFLFDRAVRLSAYIAGRSQDNALEDKLYSVLIRGVGVADVEIDIIAKRGIGRLMKYRDAVIKELLFRFSRGDPQVDGYSVTEWASTHFSDIVSAVADLITTGKYPERCSEALFSLCHREGSAEEKEKVVDLLYLGISKNLIKYSSFNHAVEYMLHSVDTQSLRLRMADFAGRISIGNPAVRVNLIYFAASAYHGNTHNRGLQDDIFELLTKHETDLDNRLLLVRTFAAQGLDRSDPLDYLLRIAREMSLKDFHDSLIGAAILKPDFAMQLAEWLESDPRLSPYGRTQEFLDGVRGGQTPYEAARAFLAEKGK